MQIGAISGEEVSINDAREWLMGFPERRQENEGEEPYPELTATANIVWLGGQERTILLCVTWFDGMDDSIHLGVQMQVCPDYDEEEEAEALVDVGPPEECWTLEEVCRVFRIDPDSPIWTRETD